MVMKVAWRQGTVVDKMWLRNHESNQESQPWKHGKGFVKMTLYLNWMYLSITYKKYEAIVAPGTKKTIQWTRLQSKVGQLAVDNIKLPVCRVGAGEAWLTCSVQWSTGYVVTAPEYPSLEWGRPGTPDTLPHPHTDNKPAALSHINTAGSGTYLIQHNQNLLWRN